MQLARTGSAVLARLQGCRCLFEVDAFGAGVFALRPFRRVSWSELRVCEAEERGCNQMLAYRSPQVHIWPPKATSALVRTRRHFAGSARYLSRWAVRTGKPQGRVP